MGARSSRSSTTLELRRDGVAGDRRVHAVGGGDGGMGLVRGRKLAVGDPLSKPLEVDAVPSTVTGPASPRAVFSAASVSSDRPSSEDATASTAEAEPANSAFPAAGSPP